MIVISAGHYPLKPGCVRNGIKEHTYTVLVANQIMAYLTQFGIKFARTPDTTLYSKIQWINRFYPDAQLCVEVHFNCIKGKAGGTEVLYHHKSKKGKVAAQCLYNQIQPILGLEPRGIKSDKKLHKHLGFLSHTIPPAVITESLFLSNPNELALLQQGKIRDRIAYAHAVGIVNYLTTN